MKIMKNIRFRNKILFIIGIMIIGIIIKPRNIITMTINTKKIRTNMMISQSTGA